MMFMGGMVAVALIGVLVVVLIVTGLTNSDDRSNERAEQLLAERFAAGEIDEQELHSRQMELRRSGRRPLRSSPWALVASIVVLVILIVILIAWGTGMNPRWWDHRGHRGHMGFSGGNSDASSEPVAGATEVTVRAGDLWFDPERIEASGDTAFNITVSNEGEVFHDLIIDELEVRIDVEAGDRVTAGITDVEPGTYDFYCSVAGHAQAGMTGTLVVDPAN